MAKWGEAVIASGRETRRRARWSRRRLLGAALAALLVASFAFIGFRLYDETTALRQAPRDNVQWSLAQIEVELLRLANAVAASDGEAASLQQVRRRFDIFYSRISTVASGEIFSDLREDPAAQALITEIRGFLDRAAPLIDGPDAALTAALDDLADELNRLRETGRKLSLVGVRTYAEDSDKRRRAFEELLLVASLFATGLILVLAFTLTVLVRQNRLAALRAAEAAQSRERLVATFNASLDPIIVADGAGRILEYNAAAERIFGFPREEAVGADMGEMIVPEPLRTAHKAGMARYMATREAHVVGKGRVEMTALRASGEEFPVELSIGASEGADGPIFIGFLRDISRRQAAERELRVARDAAMAADRAKSEFLAVMSHEMRTPLNGVLGVLDLLGRTSLDPRQSRYVDVATASGEILLRHINDVLDITRIEAGKMEFAAAPLDLDALVAGVAEIGRPAAEALGTRIDWRADAPTRPLAGDAHRIRQVLLNLVGNAAKFTRDGRISVAARVIREDGDGAEVEFIVEDTGVGFSQDDAERVFEDFVTLDADYDRETSGSGLGLAICRRIVTTMGGEIGVDSAPGEGSRFWVRLSLAVAKAPREPGSPAPAGPRTAPPAAALDVLLVEDNETNRMVARDMLELAGHTVTEARDGAEGVAKAKERSFDLILMDVSMPGVDGVEATRMIRASAGPSRKAPIIGLTAHALPDEQRRFLDAGMQDCLTKPIRMQNLYAALGREAEGAPQAGAVGDAADALIDDEVLSEMALALPRETLARTLRKVCEEIAAFVPAIAEASDAGEMEKLAARAHKLAGSAALVGGRRLNTVLGEIESAANTGDAAKAAAAAEALPEAATATLAVLSEFAGETPPTA